jgi:hypothetical protein
VRSFVLVTDFIGTGSQAKSYLDAAWRVSSTKSWVSGKFLKFAVVCYTSTPSARRLLESHPSSPKVHEIISCPTLKSFAPYKFDPVVSLCEKYGPKDSETKIPKLGFGNVGALIAFSHGMPNNAPRLLFQKGRKWKPLFPSRATTLVRRSVTLSRQDHLNNRLRALRETQLAKFGRASGLDPRNGMPVLVLAALKRKPRTVAAVSARTGLEVAETLETMERVRRVGWIDQDNRLTAKAYRELEYLRRPGSKKVSRYTPRDGYYFPEGLREPVEGFR